MLPSALAEFRVIGGDEDPVVLNVDTLRLFRVDRSTASLCKRLADGWTLSAAAAEVGVPLKEAEAGLISLRNPVPPPPLDRPLPADGLNRLVLLVSQRCNMRCKYCYAGDGSYGSATAAMSSETARKAVARLREVFGAVRSVQMMGGEPMLNVAAMRAACEEACAEQQRRPLLGMVMNGTVLPVDGLDLVEEYGISTNISWDGPSEIHDALRRDTRGRGTSQSVLHALDELRGRGRRVQAGITLTALHDRWGIGPYELVEQALDLGFDGAYLACVSVPSSHSLGLDMEAVSRMAPSFGRLAGRFWDSILAKPPRTINPVSARTLALLRRDYNPRWCNAALGTLCVDASGDVYPCHMFAGQERFCMGNVCDPAFPGGRFWSVRALFAGNVKGLDDACRTCWLRGLCCACVAGLIMRTGALGRRDPAACATETAIVGAVLQGCVARFARTQGGADHGVAV